MKDNDCNKMINELSSIFKVENTNSLDKNISHSTIETPISMKLIFIHAPKFYFVSAPLHSTDLHLNAKWRQNGATVAGGNGRGNKNEQLNNPVALYVDDDQTIYIVDQSNHRIVKWKWIAASGQVLAGGNGKGNEIHQLSNPRDVIVDKERDSLIICDGDNRRVVLWPRRNERSVETIISNISCRRLTMDEDGSLYVTDDEKNEVRRYQRRESQGTVVAGGNGEGNRTDQLSNRTYVFVDRDHSVYVSDQRNHRVMKWVEGEKQGIVVAGGQGQGSGLTQLSNPHGVIVDQLGTVYVVDEGNHRIMRWPQKASQGSVIIGGKGYGPELHQLKKPLDLSFDRHGNLYVVDNENQRVQRFSIDSNT
jgi:sugar lactone lactonase YvrE